jgi:TPR repeat protein
LAQNNLGLMYYYGDGIAQDYKKAKYWIELAMNQGNRSAMSNWKKFKLYQY